MKNVWCLMLVLCAALFLLACQKQEPAAGSATAAATPAAQPAAGAPAPSSGPEVSPEMKEFLGMMKGSHKDVEAALQKFGVEKLATADMDMYDLKEPLVTSVESFDGKTSVYFEAKAGITVRSYKVDWQNGKIVAVEDRGMR